MKRFYVTTPLYYVNDKPHIGTAYTTIMADVLNRYHRLFGEETLFLTGTDEHGQKCQQAAQARGLSPLDHCNDMVMNFRNAWQELEINYDIFFRTTAPDHAKVVQTVLQELFDKGDIYADEYEGWYCVSEEIFYTEKELVDGKTPTGKPVEKVVEKNYFFKMSKYQDQLIQHIEKHPKFIQPDSRKNEVLGFLRQQLGDLCISRPKTRLNWGIEIPFDRDYVTYVWFDALLNYASGVGLRNSSKAADYKKWWCETGATHLLGKDIITTHAVYWTTMLMAMGEPLPRQIFAHGWILNKDSAKMSKSSGDVINPLDMKELIGVDAFRYFLVREIHFGNDAPFSKELVVNRINTELANNLGNLLSRTLNLLEKNYGSKIPQPQDLDARTQQLVELMKPLAQNVKTEIENMRPSYALELIVQILNEANRYLEEKAPWKSVKEDLATTGTVLYAAAEILRVTGTLMLPVMPTKCMELLRRLGISSPRFEDTEKWGVLKPGTQIDKGTPLFPRIV